MKTLPNKELGAKQDRWPQYMQQALDLAVSVINAAPNPRVGCVLLAGETTVGKGWHCGAGEDHAELMALKHSGDLARSSTAFVSLEPCAHTGRTGPCCDALIDAGVSVVVIASIDPNPEVSGQGVSKMEAAGIEVFHLLDFDKAARSLNPGYFKHRETGLPYVRCKMAMSLDGRTALANGDSKWITGPLARKDVQKLRAASSAIITGIGTVLKDDPCGNVRPDELGFSEEELQKNTLSLSRQPLRVIVDSCLRTPGTAKILKSPGEVKIFYSDKGAEEKGAEERSLAPNVEIVKADGSGQRVNLRSVLESLACDYSCTEILLEAGSVLSGAFISEGLVDELIVYIAPKLLGADAKGLLGITGLKSLSESLNFEILELDLIGTDIRLRLTPLKESL